MLRMLRVIQFPKHLHTSANWIKANTVLHVQHYEDLIAQAQREAEDILAEARQEAAVIRGQARQEAAESLRADMNACLDMAREQQNKLRQQIRLMCEQICLAVMDRFIVQTEDQVRIKALVEDLIAQSYNARELHVHCHPKHEESTSRAVAEVLSEKLNFRKFQVHPSNELAEFELKVLASNGSEIRIGLENMLALLSDEVVHFIQQSPDVQQPELDPHSR